MLLVEDRGLLDAFRRGERPALERVYTTFAPAVAAFLRRGFSFESGGRACRFQGTRSTFDLEDRLHDVFARAFGEAARLGYDGLSSYRTYLFTIARNLIIDDFRRKEHALVGYLVDESAEPVSPPREGASEPFLGELEPTGDPARDAESSQLLALVSAVRDELPSREREVFRLRFQEEREHKEIAAATGLSPSKIKTSEQRIRARFFEVLRRHGYLRERAGDDRSWLETTKPAGVKGG